MSVTKRTRFEVLKRDDHTCRYCGGSPPDVKLTIDHVVPVALGGSDAPDNLVAACRDCNAGKSSSSPDAALVNEVADDAIRWAQAMRQAALEMQTDRERNSEIHDRFQKLWLAYGDSDCSNLPSDFRQSIDTWLDAGLPASLLIDSLEIAMGNRAVPFHSVFRYMAGIVKNRIADLHERARQIVGEEAPDAP